jgi:hypothetical protein
MFCLKILRDKQAYPYLFTPRKEELEIPVSSDPVQAF